MSGGPSIRGKATGPNPTDRGKPGSKRHLAVAARDTPLGIALSGANRHDSKMLTATLDAVPPVRSGKRGRPRRRPAKLHADKAYDHQRWRHECRARGIQPVHRCAMNRPTPGGRQRPARPVPLDRGTHLRLARPLPPPHRALRAPRRRPPRFHHARLRHHLLQAASPVLALAHRTVHLCQTASPHAE